MSSTGTLAAAPPQPRSPLASSYSSTPPTSPHSPKSPSHNPRRPSISNTMHWLSRNPTSGPSSQPYSPSKPVKISEPKRVRTIDAISAPGRNGVLGAGATVVRTPDEALRETGVRLSPELSEKASSSSSRLSVVQDDPKKKRPSTPVAIKPAARHSGAASTLMNEPISPPTSPPLPPIPLASDLDEDLIASEPESPVSSTKSPPRPTRAPPPAPSIGSRRSSMKGRRTSSTEDAPVVPPLPPHVIASTLPPSFHALLVVEPPLVTMDPSKVIVTLETCTQTHKTTLSTIYSRPSHLSTYFSTLFEPSDKHSTASLYSSESDDLAMYNRHLTSQGLLPPSINVHIFLDRPSSPYSHILSYLRCPIVEGQPEVLPRSLQLNSSTSAQVRLENLIEVRDEAAFLNLEGLHKLCSDEIRLRYGPKVHTRGNSTSAMSIHSLRASIYSLHTLLERVETDLEANNNTSATDTPTISPAKLKPSSPVEITFPARSPPTPQSWDGPRLEQRSQSRSSQNRQSPPAGWI